MGQEEAAAVISVQVTCYSGHTYPERPQSFTWEGQIQRVEKVEKEWREPGWKHFMVCTEKDRRFELCYYEEAGRWSAVELV